VYLIGGIAGGLLGGFSGDHIIHSHKNGRLWLCAAFAFIGAPFAYYASIAAELSIAVILWVVLYASLNTYYGLVYSAIQDIVSPSQRGTTMALYFMAMYLLGASFGSIITGGLSDHFARIASEAAGSQVITEAARASGLQQAMIVIPIVNVLLAFVLFMGSRTILADMLKRQKAAAFAV
jgi:MFS family permease